MNRRPLLATVLGGVLGTAGCIDRLGDSGPPEVNADEPELAPGEERTLHIEARHVEGVHIDGMEEAGREMIELDISNATVSPRPDVTEDMYPPKWNWRSPTSVEIELPVAAADDADAGEYNYRVSAWQGEPENREAIEPEFTITIVEEQ